MFYNTTKTKYINHRRDIYPPHIGPNTIQEANMYISGRKENLGGHDMIVIKIHFRFILYLI